MSKKVAPNITISPRLMSKHTQVEQVNHGVIEVLPEVLAYHLLDYIEFSKERLDI